MRSGASRCVLVRPGAEQAITGELGDGCECTSPCELEAYPFTTTNVKLRARFVEAIYSNTTHNFTTEYIE